MGIIGHIYCATCLPTGKLYFGQTVMSIERRFGKHLNYETKKKISLKHKGKKLSEEHRKKISENHANFRKENHPNWGRKWDNEVRKKMSESHLIKRTLIMCDLNGNEIKEFSSWTEATSYVGVTCAAIRNCAHGLIKTCKGFTWKEQN